MVPQPRDPADVFVDGPAGRFWGRDGAAGLLAHDPARGVLLQLRAPWTHSPDTWGLPGGALHAGEDAVTGALREADEEAGVPADRLTITAAHRRNEGYWSYTTVLAEVDTAFEARTDAHESADLAWTPLDAVSELPLHPGLAATWPMLRARLERPAVLIVDVANVMGARPDGWWRDRAGAARRLVDQVTSLVRRGVPGPLLGDSPAWTLHPRTIAVVEGKAKAILDTAEFAQNGASRSASAGSFRVPAVEVVGAPADGDSAIVEIVDALVDADTTVVTSDRGLRERVGSKGRALGAGSLLQVLPH